MAVFDMRGQSVHKQYNVVGALPNDAGAGQLDLVDALEKIKKEFDQAVQARAIDARTALDAEYQLKRAMLEAGEPEPRKQTLLDSLGAAKDLIVNIAAVQGLVTALVGLTKSIQSIL